MLSIIQWRTLHSSSYQRQTAIAAISTTIQPSSQVNNIVFEVLNIREEHFWPEMVTSAVAEVLQVPVVFTKLQGKPMQRLDDVPMEVCADVVEIVGRQFSR
jgi:hypothetical protein